MLNAIPGFDGWYKLPTYSGSPLFEHLVTGNTNLYAKGGLGIFGFTADEEIDETLVQPPNDTESSCPQHSDETLYLQSDSSSVEQEYFESTFLGAASDENSDVSDFEENLPQSESEEDLLLL